MITIQKSETADTRTCDFSKVSKMQLKMSSHQHIRDVQMALAWFRRQLYTAGENHDSDKITNIG